MFVTPHHTKRTIYLNNSTQYGTHVRTQSRFIIWTNVRREFVDAQFQTYWMPIPYDNYYKSRFRSKWTIIQRFPFKCLMFIYFVFSIFHIHITFNHFIYLLSFTQLTFRIPISILFIAFISPFTQLVYPLK